MKKTCQLLPIMQKLTKFMWFSCSSRTNFYSLVLFFFFSGGPGFIINCSNIYTLFCYIVGSKLLYYVKLIFFFFLCVFISPLFFLFLHPFTLKISAYFKIFSPLFLADVPTISLHLLLLLVQKNFYPTVVFEPRSLHRI